MAPQMSPVHFELISAALNRSGYRVEILDKAGPADVETGLKYVNNDACYPSILVVGQLIHALQSGRFDPDACTLMITTDRGPAGLPTTSRSCERLCRMPVTDRYRYCRSAYRNRDQSGIPCFGRSSDTCRARARSGRSASDRPAAGSPL